MVRRCWIWNIKTIRTEIFIDEHRILLWTSNETRVRKSGDKQRILENFAREIPWKNESNTVARDVSRKNTKQIWIRESTMKFRLCVFPWFVTRDHRCFIERTIKTKEIVVLWIFDFQTTMIIVFWSIDFSFLVKQNRTKKKSINKCLLSIEILHKLRNTDRQWKQTTFTLSGTIDIWLDFVFKIKRCLRCFLLDDGNRTGRETTNRKAFSFPFPFFTSNRSARTCRHFIDLNRRSNRCEEKLERIKVLFCCSNKAKLNRFFCSTIRSCWKDLFDFNWIRTVLYVIDVFSGICFSEQIFEIC